MGYSKNNNKRSQPLRKKRYGYTITSKILITMFNLSFVWLLIILTAPVLLLIGAIIKVKNNGSIFYLVVSFSANPK